MGIRDQEISRLVSYAEGLGVKVKFNNLDPSDSGGWCTDGSEITISKKNNKTKIDVILSLIHELGHHVWFIHEKNRKPDLKFEEALTRQNLYEEDIAPTPAPKKLRKKILNIEKASASWWHLIYKETNMKFPIWRLEFSLEYDYWQYEVYYETGHFPRAKERKLKTKELNLKYKGNK